MLSPASFEWTQISAHNDKLQAQQTRHARRSTQHEHTEQERPKEERSTQQQQPPLQPHQPDMHHRKHSSTGAIPSKHEHQHSNGAVSLGASSAKDAADAAAHSRAHSREIPAAAASQLPPGQQQHAHAHRASYSTDAYRSFMQQATGSAAVSAANSRAQSRRGSLEGSAHSSAASSGMSSLAPSGSNTRVPSPSNTNAFGFDPSSLHYEAEAAAAAAAAARNGSATIEHQIKPQSFGEGTQLPHQQPHQPHQHHRRSLPLSGQSGQLSLAGLSLPHSRADSLDGESSQPHVPGSQARIRPVHFTFAQADVVNSFRKAAEKEKARLELQQEREREAQERAAIAQEYELAKTQKLMQQQREQTMREAAYKLAAQRKELDAQRIRDAQDDALSTSDDEANSGSSSDAYSTASEGEEDSFDRASPHPHQRHKRRHHRTPILPTHFKFDATDVRRSYAKPSARQQIGPWTGFPRSSTVMLPGAQLRSVLNRRIAAQIQQSEGERKLASAPTSPSVHRDREREAQFSQAQAIRQQLGEKSGSFSSREAQQQRAQARRASLPLISSFAAPAHNSNSHHHAHTSSAPSLPPIDSSSAYAAAHLPQPQPQRARSAGHSQSGSVDPEKSKDLAHHAAHSRSGSSAVQHRGGEKNTNIRAASSGHTRTSSADAVDFSKLYQQDQQHATGRPSAAVPVKALPQASIEAAAPRRSAIAHHGSRLTGSTHVSPLRRERMVQAQARSATLPAGYHPSSSSSSHAHLPPTQPGSVLSTQTISRRMPSAAAAAMWALGGAEAKVGSATSSPMAAATAGSSGHAHSPLLDYRSTAHGLPPVAHRYEPKSHNSIDNWNTPLHQYQAQQHHQSRPSMPLASLYANVNVHSSGYGR